MDKNMNLELVLTEDMINELAKRYSDIIICMREDESKSKENIKTFFNGNQLVLMGLIERTKYKIMEDTA
jgi:hypothetical protein